MTRRLAIMLCVPVLLAVAVAAPLAQWRGPQHGKFAAAAVALTVPVGMVTLRLAFRSGRVLVYGPVLAMAAGMFLRVAVGFGGAVLLLVAGGGAFRGEPLVFMGWVLGLYLTTLTVELALIGTEMMAKARR
ncbi:hypothetical protein [Gemmata sp.]|uniref:hypothetical protein n=1 Tax=Gemmata sp. TaxID=1914242 RepID=UPI003F701DBB